MSIRELRQTPALVTQPLSEALQAAAFMMTGGLAHPVIGTADGPAAAPDPAPARALNAAIARANVMGGTMTVMASPVIGTGVGVDFAETLMLPEIQAGRSDPAALVEHVLSRLQQTGRSVLKDGKPVTDAAVARTEMTATVNRLLAERMGLWTRLGLLAG